MKSRIKSISIRALAGLLALAYIIVGLPKLMDAPRQIAYIMSWGLPVWSRFPIGIGELALAAGILIPPWRKGAAYGVFIWFVLAEFTLLHSKPPQYEAVAGPMVYLLLAVGIFWLSKAKPKVSQQVEPDKKETI